MRAYLKVALLVVVTTALVWLPFALKIESLPGWGLVFDQGLPTIWKNYDGPNYIIVAKTWYNKNEIAARFSNPLPLEYYPAHLPFYPATIRLLNFFLPGTRAMLLSTLAGSVLAFGMFYKYLNDLKLTKRAIWLTTVLLVLPARFLAVRTIGAPETWFVFFILASLYQFRRKKYFWAFFWGALAQLTKSPAILLFVSYALSLGYDQLKNKKLEIKKILLAWPLLLIPVVIYGLFLFYKSRTGNFWAYFQSGDNFHLFWPPFSIFSPKGKFWTGDFWLEEVLFTWLIYGLGALRLWRKKLTTEAFFMGTFFATTLFIAHRDVSRYILPIAPLAILAWKDVILKKEFRWILLLMIIPVYLFTWDFLINNQAPIADWAPYL
jgi:hypothetical protein